MNGRFLVRWAIYTAAYLILVAILVAMVMLLAASGKMLWGQ